MNRIEPKDIATNSVELLCEKMTHLRQVPMDDDTSKLMIMFLMAEDSRERAAEILNKVWQAEAIVNRMKAQFGRTLDPRAAIIIASWAKSIGSCVLYMYYCQYQAMQGNLEDEFDINNLIEVFPFGFFQDEDMHKIWDEQKVLNDPSLFAGLPFSDCGDNMVDYMFASQSMCGVVQENTTA